MQASTDFGTYDYIIVGAGSAGCLLANRLTANPETRVLLLEAGGKDDWMWIHIPAGYIYTIASPRTDWRFKTTPQASLGGREIGFPRGKVIGGSSSINAMIYMRGQAADYDGWSQMGLSGWGWDDVLPFFKRHEDHIDTANAFHAQGGELRVEHPRVKWTLLEAIRDAAEAAGIEKIADFNTGDNAGSSYFQVTQRAGRRWSAARAFLDPAIQRPNLRLEIGVMVERVLFDGKRACGVRFHRGGLVFDAKADGELILSAGAVASPKILELSGIGDGARLADLGVAAVQHSPGVGENLQDHPQLRPAFRVQGVPTLNTDYRNLFRRARMGIDYALFRTGPLTMAPSQLGAFAKSSPRYATPNLQFHFQPLSLEAWGAGLDPFPAFTASVCNLRPTSRGFIHAASPDPHADPVISPNYLATEEDRQVASDSLRLARHIVAQKPLARYRPQEFRPGPQLTTEAEMREAAAQMASTIFHPAGSAAMGPDHDPMAVLDERMRVRGVTGLRVIDTSAMPRVVSGNTNAPTIMMAEKGAAMVLSDARTR